MDIESAQIKLISVSFVKTNVVSKISSTKNISKKDIIVKKAAVLFRKKGFSAASMRELAETIGVEASSLYNHIGSKGELLQSICFKVANDFMMQLNEVENRPVSIALKIENIIRFHVNMMLDHFDEVYVANHEWKQLKEPLLSNFLHQRKGYESRLIQLIEQGIQKKEIKTIQPSIAVLTILSAVRGLEYWHRHKKSINREEIESNMIHQLLFGLIKK